MNAERIDFERIKAAALASLPGVIAWLGLEGRYEGHEFVCRNPRRLDRRPGSFKINTRTGLWADFALSGVSGDVVDLVAYVQSISNREAALRLAAQVGFGGM